MERLIEDVRYGVRGLRRSPGFACAAVLSIALGIGASTAVFSVIDVALLSPPAFPHLDRLVWIYDWDTRPGAAGTKNSPSPGNFLDWRSQTSAFDQMAAWQNWYVSLGDEGVAGSPPVSVRGVHVSPSFFSMLGVEPAIGRTFRPNEEAPGRDRVVLLTDSLWKSRFAARPDIIGQTVRIDRQPYSIVGVLPKEFCFLQPDFQLWMPLAVDEAFHLRNTHSVQVFGRLAPGVSLAQAQAQLDTLAAALESAHPETNRGWRTRLEKLYPSTAFNAGARDFASAVLMLGGAVGFVLLIACANVANLLLSRGVARQREIAIRTALGATRVRLIRQMLTESLLLASLGAACGVVLADWGLLALTPLLPRLPVYRVMQPSIDGGVLAFTTAMTVLAGILFGLPPAFQSTAQAALRARAPRSLFAGRLLLGLQLALSTVLLVGATLLVKSLVRLERAGPGFDAGNLLTMQVWLPRTKYPEPAGVTDFYRQALERVNALPGVESAGAINMRPFLGMAVATAVDVEGRGLVESAARPVVDYKVITPGYLRMLRVPFLSGRDLSDVDVPGAPGAVLVNEAAARRLWPGASPLGKRVRPIFHATRSPWEPIPDRSLAWFTVAGVVGNTREGGPVDREPAELYFSYRQLPSPFMFLVVRTARDPGTLAAAVRREILGLDSDQPVSDVRTMNSAILESLAAPRLNARLAGIFVLFAVFLSAAGVYGVMSYSVNRRTQTIAIHMALGARPRDVQLMLLGEAGRIAGAAVGTGLLASIWLARALKSLLYGMTPNDPLIFAGACLVLLAVAMAACYAPAGRAARVDPMVAMRDT